MLLRWFYKPDNSMETSAEMESIMRINHNISAQLANVNLKRASSRVSTSLERLTSGYKINKAADDASGLAITNKMRAQIRALDQASRNSLDGQSIIETAEGALSELTNVMQRIRELSVQAANDVYTLDDRTAIQSEVDQLMDEIDRIASTTEFNGTSLLDGSASRTVRSDSAKVNALSVSMSVEAGDYEFDINQLATTASTTFNYNIPATADEYYTVKLNGLEIKISSTDTDDSVTKRVMEICDVMNIDVIGTGSGMELKTKVPGSSQRIEIQYPGETEATVYTGTDASISFGDGFEDSATYSADGNFINIIDNDGFRMQVELEEGAAGAVTLSAYDAGYMTIQIGANEGQNLDMDFPKVTCVNLGLKTSEGESMINVCTQFGATHAISAMDAALNSLTQARSQLGAYQNRLESTSASLDISSENITESMSRIGDTDMAAEMTEYTQQDVLSQAATSMLAQANNRPQQIMSLLQG